MGKLARLGLLLVGAGIVAVVAYYGWRATRPREISVCAVTDYAYRQRSNWEESLAIRFAEVNRIFGAVKIIWKLVPSAAVDPTSSVASLDQRRSALDQSLDCRGDVKLSLTGIQSGRRTGSVNPFSRALIVVDRPQKSDKENALILANALATLFGAKVEPAGTGTIMTDPPESDKFSEKALALIRALRDYPFAAGTEGLTPEWTGRALQALRVAMPEKGGNPDVQANRVLALALANERKMEAALPFLREAQKIEPNNALVRAEIAGALVQLSQGPDALKEINEAVRLAPEDATLRAAYANVLAKTGDPDAGIEEWKKAIAMAPKNVVFRLSLGAALLQEPGRIDEAVATFQEAVKLEPDSRFVTNTLERAEAQKKNLQERASTQRQIAAEGPPTFQKLFTLGYSELMAGNLDAAAKALEKASEIDRSNGRSHAALAAIRYLRKDYPGAWREVKASRAANYEPPASLLVALGRRQPE